MNKTKTEECAPDDMSTLGVDTSHYFRLFGVTAETNDPVLAGYLGAYVQYRDELINDDFETRHGIACREMVFQIRFVQRDIHGFMALRGYGPGDEFGRILYPEQIRIARLG